MTTSNYKKFRYLVLIIGVVLFYGSCVKQWFGFTRLSGVVTEKGSGLGIEGVTVKLLGKDGGSWSFTNVFKVKETVTNSKGEYELDFDAERGYNYYIEVSKDKYLPTESVYYINERKKNDINPVMNSTAVLKVHIYNSSPFNEFDYITIVPYSFNEIVELYGKNIDTSVFITVFGNQINLINYLVNKNDLKEQRVISSYCPAFDTTNFELNY